MGNLTRFGGWKYFRLVYNMYRAPKIVGSQNCQAGIEWRFVCQSDCSNLYQSVFHCALGHVYLLMSARSWNFELVGTKLAWFYQKNEWASRNLLYFLNWHSAKFDFSESIFTSKNQSMLSGNGFLYQLSIM